MNRTLRNIIIASIQFIVFGFIIYNIFEKFSFQDFIASFRTSNLPFILLGALCIFLNEVILGTRWFISSVALKISLPLRFFISGSFIVRFLDYLLPIPAADEIYKVLLLKLKGIEINRGIASALFDKLLGMGILLLLLPFSLILLLKRDIIIQSQFNTVLILGGLTVFLFIIIFTRPQLITSNIIKALKYIPIKKFSEIKVKDASIQYDYSKLSSHVFLVILSLFLQASAILCLFFAFGIQVNIFTVLFLLPIMILSKILPISYQGFGLYEASMVFLLGILGSLPQNIIMNVSVLHLGIFTFIHLMGGLVFWRSGIRTEFISAIKKF